MTSDIHVRKATLDDTQAICKLFQERIDVWQRLNAQGRVENLPYEALTIYERWLHGGPWMTIETGAIFLNHLLHGAGVALVAVEDGFVLGYAEAYPGSEPEPYGTHLHIGQLAAHFEQAEEIKDALMQHLIHIARQQHLKRITASFSGYDDASAAFYQHYAMHQLTRVGCYTLPAQTGQSFYKAVPQLNPDPAQINGWHMTIGRVESARQHWETLWARLFDSIPEIAARQTHRLQFSAAGHDALICCQKQLHDSRSADIYCWSPKPLTTQLLMSIRDWAYRQNYRTLVLTVPESTSRVLGQEAETTPYQQDVYALDV